MACCRLGLAFVEQHFPAPRTKLGTLAVVAPFGRRPCFIVFNISLHRKRVCFSRLMMSSSFSVEASINVTGHESNEEGNHSKFRNLERSIWLSQNIPSSHSIPSRIKNKKTNGKWSRSTTDTPTTMRNQLSATIQPLSSQQALISHRLSCRTVHHRLPIKAKATPAPSPYFLLDAAP